VDVTESLDTRAPAEHLFSIVEDLADYPAWLTIVPVAEPLEVEVVPEDGDGRAMDGPAWSVELRGRIGPLARSKRLRMVRTRHEPPVAVRFERHELDGREHSPWILEATIEALGEGSRLTMHLHYGGGFGTSVLDRLLREEIERSRPRLAALAEAGLPLPPASAT
jgi:hypothetical protein